MAKQLHILHEQPELSVTQISNLIKKKVEDTFDQVKIRGEISGLKIAPSGHAYFSLKDQNSVLACVMWRGNVLQQKIKLEDGAEVVANGSITTYAGQSKYQLITESFSLAGIGALMMLLEKRKKQFEQEGLFDPKHKKGLPLVPKKIGVVTSLSGVVIRDIIHRIKDRFPSHIVIWPALMQGEKSAYEVASAIEGFNKLEEKPDLLIIARGGGSIEDLWSFNEEIVIRAAFNSKIPIISAIGHETDITLLDYVADLRAPTPTAAAELALPVRNDLLFTINNINRRLQLRIVQFLQQKLQIIKSFGKAFPNIKTIFENKIQRLDDRSLRLIQAIDIFFERKITRMHNFANKIKSPIQILANKNSILQITCNNFYNKLNNLLGEKTHKLSMLGTLINTLSYQSTLKRGFAIIWDQEQIISSKESVSSGKKVLIELKDGKIEAHIK